MSNEIITYKIELLKAQITDLEKSGFFTEKEMDSKSAVLKEEIQKLILQMNLYGMTYDEYQDRKKMHDYYMSWMNLTSESLTNIRG